MGCYRPPCREWPVLRPDGSEQVCHEFLCSPLLYSGFAHEPDSDILILTVGLRRPSELVRSDTTGQKSVAIWRELSAIWKDKAGVELS